MRALLLALMMTVSGGATAAPYHLIPGRVPLDWQGPDGNTVVLNAPRGLIVVDTGRSPTHAQSILDYARQRGKPIAAIVNTHWHLDHTTGNLDIRKVYPRTEVYASNAIEGALVGFLNRGRAQADKIMADPSTPPGQRAQLIRGRYRVDHPHALRPTRPVTRSARMIVAGRKLDVQLARFAATEGDVWIYDPVTRTAIVGDLVVGIVPFMDTACPEGWSKALADIARVPFKTLIPGHGVAMTRTDFNRWRSAYNRFLDCGRSPADKEVCIDGWARDAARFIDPEHRAYVRSAVDYYLTTRLRSSPDEQRRYCRLLKAP